MDNDVMNKAEEATDTLHRVQDTARAKLSEVSERMADASTRMMERSRAAATSTDAYIHEYAWSSIALAALLGVVIGLMIRRP